MKDSKKSVKPATKTTAREKKAPPKLKAEVHCSADWLHRLETAGNSANAHIIESIHVEASGNWGGYDGNKIALAAKRAAERELNNQAREYYNGKLFGGRP